MDPNANLKEMLELASSIQEIYEQEDGNGIDLDDANRLAQLVESLNGWITNGGFLPAAWQQRSFTQGELRLIHFALTNLIPGTKLQPPSPVMDSAVLNLAGKVMEQIG